MSYHWEILTTHGDDLNRWLAYYDQLTGKAIYHHPEYIDLIADHFQGWSELFLLHTPSGFIYHPYLRRSLVDLPFANQIDPDMADCTDVVSSWYYGGPLVGGAEINDDLVRNFELSFDQYCREQGIVSEFIRLDPNLKNEALLPGESISENRQTVYVDLAKGLDEITADMSSANRRAVRKAGQAGFDLKFYRADRPDAWAEFHKIYHNEMVRKQAPSHLYFPAAFFNSLYQKMPQNFVLIAAERQGRISGGFIIVHDQEFAFHFLSASRPEYWPERINNFLFFEAIRWAKQAGCKTFDFMGGRDGVYRFKSNFSSTRKTFKTCQRIHDESAYQRLTDLRFRVQPGSPDGYFPAYRKPLGV